MRYFTDMDFWLSWEGNAILKQGKFLTERDQKIFDRKEPKKFYRCKNKHFFVKKKIWTSKVKHFFVVNKKNPVWSSFNIFLGVYFSLTSKINFFFSLAIFRQHQKFTFLARNFSSTTKKSLIFSYNLFIDNKKLTCSFKTIFYISFFPPTTISLVPRTIFLCFKTISSSTWQS